MHFGVCQNANVCYNFALGCSMSYATVRPNQERWQSGRMRWTRNPVYVFGVPSVRIRPFPPDIQALASSDKPPNQRLFCFDRGIAWRSWFKLAGIRSPESAKRLTTRPPPLANRTRKNATFAVAFLDYRKSTDNQLTISCPIPACRPYCCDL